MEPGAVVIEGVAPPGVSEESLKKILVKREEWKALPSAGESEPLVKRSLMKLRLMRNLGYPNCDTRAECMRIVQEMQRKDIARGGSDIHYNFVVGSDGLAYEGLGWYKKPPDDPNFSLYQDEYIEIALIGDQRYARHENQVFTTTAELIEYAINHGVLHHDFLVVPDDTTLYEEP